MELLEYRNLLSANLTPANVLVLYNSASPAGTQIANYYAQVHAGVHLLGINGIDPNSENISADAYLSTIRPQVLAALTPSIDVIVTTKGLPLRITVTEPEPTAVWPNLPTYLDPSGVTHQILSWQSYSSLESELTNINTVSTWQMMGDQSSQIPGQFSSNPYFHSTSSFSPTAYGGMILTSRLDGYTVSDVEGAIDRAQNVTVGPNNSPLGPDWFLVDNDPSINYSPTMASLVNNVLSPAGLPVVYDDTSAFVSTAPGPVIGYDSQGVHQSSTPPNYLTNGLNITLAKGAVFNSWESYNAYSFTPGGYSGTQGQVAQWLAMGGTAGVGNVQEPGASPSSVANEDQLFLMLLSGKTWAEAAWSSLPQLGFVNTVVGDPLMTWTRLPAVSASPVVSLSGSPTAPNFSTTWFNNGPVPIANNVIATVTAAPSVTTLNSLTVTLSTYHPGDVLSVPILNGFSLTTSYSAGTLSLSGTDTVAHYQQALRFISYDNTAGGSGTSPITATFVANDGSSSSLPVTATININVASGQVLGNRLFYNNSKYDGNDATINSSDDAAIASDKTGYTGTGTATFANVSSFNKGITGIMVDLQSGLGTHSAINLTSGDITFKVSPASFVTTTYNQLSTWSAAPSPSAISVRMGAGQGGSDRLEFTWATGAIKNEWIEIDVIADGNTGLAVDDVFYFGSLVGDSGAGDSPTLAKVDATDYNAALNNIVGFTTPVWNLADYTKNGRVDGNDASSAINNIFSLHYIADPIGPFTSGIANGSAAPAVSPAVSSAASPASAVASGLSTWNASSTTSTSPRNTPQPALTSPPVTKASQSAPQNPLVLQAIDQIASKFTLHDDALDGLLADLGLG